MSFNVNSSNSPLLEVEWLDYKIGNDKHVEEHWSKALSGFGNSGGGIIIWGIRTDSQDGQDIPVGVSLAENPLKLEGLLKTALAYAVDPPVLGVKIRSLSNQDGNGFVVAYIPESPLKPHRAERGKTFYYIRAGHQFSPANTALLRILFYPQKNPKIEPFIYFSKCTGPNAFELHISLKNTGIVTVHDPHIVLYDNSHTRRNGVLSFQPSEHYTMEVAGASRFHIFGQLSLHPKWGDKVGTIILSSPSPLRLIVYGRDMEPSTWEITHHPGTENFSLLPV